ncbi:MAG: GNAT family N-acetyltransferase [Deltaproteobacteria bacterium]|nr:GNAT family N-acetyltransferase [Deltaproteobacteria bacterium]
MTLTEPQASKIAMPLLEIGGIRLRAVRDADLPFLFDLSTSFETLHLWDDGQIETVEMQFVDVFKQKAHSRTFFIVESIASNKGPCEPIGLAYLYSFEPINGWAYYTIALLPSHVGRGSGHAASVLSIEWAFHSWSLHKLYVEILSENIAAIEVATCLGFEREARFRQHRRIAGERFDVEVLALNRQRWVSEFRSRAIERAVVKKARS